MENRLISIANTVLSQNEIPFPNVMVCVRHVAHSGVRQVAVFGPESRLTSSHLISPAAGVRDTRHSGSGPRPPLPLTLCTAPCFKTLSGKGSGLLPVRAACYARPLTLTHTCDIHMRVTYTRV